MAADWCSVEYDGRETDGNGRVSGVKGGGVVRLGVRGIRRG